MAHNIYKAQCALQLLACEQALLFGSSRSRVLAGLAQIEELARGLYNDL